MVVKLAMQALKYANKNHVKHIVWLGDICEKTRLSYEGMLAFIKLLRTPFEHHVILGNHDMFGPEPELGHSLQVIKELKLPNVHIYEKPTIVDFGKAKLNFLPWPHQDFDKTCMNIAHVDVQGAKSDSGRLFDSDKLSKSKAHAIIGHIHTNQRIRNSWYTGTLYQTNFGESLDKYFQHVTYDSGEWEIQNIPVKPIYRLHTVEVLTKADLKSVPASEFDLVKLILLDGCEVEAENYKHLNVVKVNAVSTARELALARMEDLADGSEIEVSADEFFKEWLDAQSVEAELKLQAVKLRKQILEKA
jgi:DNA repair exonuclease SbcCD nuclease subunit